MRGSHAGTALVAAVFWCALSAGDAAAATYKVKLQSATDMEISIGGAVLTTGGEATVEGTSITAMTKGKRRLFCIDPRSQTSVGQNVVIQNQGPHGCSWSVDSGSFHGYAEWSIEKESYTFSGGGKVTQTPAGSGQATVAPPAGAASFTLSVRGETAWSYFRDAPGGRVTNRETESGSATISFTATTEPAGPQQPPAQPPRDPSYPVNGLPLCPEALAYFGIQQPAQTHIRRNFDGVLAGFTQAVETFKRNNPGTPPTVSVPNSVNAIPTALNWLFAEGGAAANLNLPGGQGLSRSFIFTPPADVGRVFADNRGLYGGTLRTTPGTEPALLQAIVAKHGREGKRKLSPGDVFGLALEQTKGDARLAALLAHNTLRSLARGADGNFTGISQNLTFFTEYLQTIRGDKLATPPAGGDGLAGDYAGPWYHLFGTTFFELQVRGAQLGAVAQPINPFDNPGTGVLSLTNAQWIMSLFNSGEFNPTMDSTLANSMEQYYREYLGGRTPDPEKYCFNVWGANMGAWLFNSLTPSLGPAGAAQPQPVIPPPAVTPQPQPQPQPAPSLPSGGWAPGGDWQVVK